MAPAMRTFLTQNDLEGKTVVPFMTNAGWPGSVIRDMTALCKGAEVVHPFEIRFDTEGGSRLITPEKEIEDWIESLKN